MEKKLTPNELKMGILLRDPLLFPLYFWKADLTIPPTRKDLPEEWRGKQVLTKEQKLMFCDISDKVLLCTARKVAKTLMIERDIIQYGILNDRRDGGLDEAMFFTPRDAHMAPVRSRVFSKIDGVPLFKLFLKNKSKVDGGAGTITFMGNLKWHFRLEGISGTDSNMSGLRAKYILGDECAYGNSICHNSRGQTALPEARWKYCGVPNGIRSSPFYSLDQTSLGRNWSRHKYPSTANPLYKSKQAWEELMVFYGGVNTQGYITQALGEWGAEVFSSFPPGTIACRQMPFLYFELTGKDFGAEEVIDDGLLSRLINLPPEVSASNIYQAVLGWDYGFSPDPAVMTLFYRTGEDNINWYQLLRIRMLRVPRPRQARLVEFINERLMGNKLLSIVTDDSGCVQILQQKELYKDRVQWANSAGNMPRLDQFGSPLLDESGNVINVRRREWAHEEFKTAMLYAPIKIPARFYMWLAEDDEKLINELAGTIERRKATGYIEFMSPDSTPGSKSPEDHATDSCRYAAVAINYVLVPRQVDDLSWDAYTSVLGWASGGDGTWKAPWDRMSAG